MKKTINGLFVLGFLLQSSVVFSADWAAQGKAILESLENYTPGENDDTWEATGPTAEDIKESERGLIRYVEQNDIEMVKIILADRLVAPKLEVTDAKGKTALMIAVEKGFDKVAQMLVDAGADTSRLSADAQKKFKKK